MSAAAETSTAAPIADRRAVEAVCLGRRETEGGKIGTFFRLVGYDQERWGIVAEGFVVGGVYRIVREGDKTIVSGDDAPRFLRRWSVESEIAEWLALDGEVDARRRTERAEKKAREMNADLSLDAWREAWKRGDWNTKQAIERRVLLLVRSGK